MATEFGKIGNLIYGYEIVIDLNGIDVKMNFYKIPDGKSDLEKKSKILS